MSDFKETIETIGQTVSVAKDVVGLISSRLEKWQQVRASTDSVLRLFYLEVSRNLELLSLLIREPKKGSEKSPKGYDFFIDHFETAVLEMILCSKEEAETFAKLKKKGRIQEHQDLPGVTFSQKNRYENVHQAMSFVYVKIDLLRKVLPVKGENALIKPIRIFERLKNIEQRLLLIKTVLEPEL